MSCASAAVHMHSVDTQERELDGSYRPRDSNHYGDDGEHNYEFDHEAILGAQCSILYLLCYDVASTRVLQCSF